MANAILTTTIFGEVAPAGMPPQALIAILNGSVYQLSYERNFDGLAPSLASAIVAGAALQASASAQPVLLASIAVDFNDDSAAQELYTVPEGFIFIPYRLDLRNASVSLTTASVSFGFNDPDFDDVIADGTYTALTGPTLYQTVFPDAGATIGEAGDVLSMLVNTEQGAAATGVVDVLGYLVAV